MLLGDIVGAVLVGDEADQLLERVVDRLDRAREVPLQRLPDVRGLGAARPRGKALERSLARVVEIDLLSTHTSEYTPFWLAERALARMTGVPIERLNPPGLHATPGYHHVTVVSAGRTAHLAGQCPLDADGLLVGDGDLARQVDQVVANTLVALAAVGVGPGDVVRTQILVASDDRDDLAATWTQLRASPLADAFTTASTLVGVARLGYPGQLVELDVTAALD